MVNNEAKKNMKKKIIGIISIGLLITSMSLAGAYISVSGINLPDVPVTLNAVNGTTSYFIITLSDVPAGHDVTNGVYPGWCADRSVTMVRNLDHNVTLYDSYDPNLPSMFQSPNWDEINWILNNKNAYTMMETQNAIWYLLDDLTWNQLSTNTRNLIESANSSGENFIPASGEIIAILAIPPQPETDCQTTFIELLIPSTTEEVCCRWTGGGTIGTNRDPRVTHGFELHSNVSELPNNLEVNWGGNHFHLGMLTQTICFDDPAIDPTPPHAGCDTIHGWGEGKYNGATGYHVEFIFTDAGEPGKVDWAWIKITDSNGGIVMEVSGFLKSGNQQAHPCNGDD